MEKEIFSSMAIDALGEMMNISLGSSATAISNMLDRRVEITTPTVSVVDIEGFSLGNLEPAMGVEIKYVSGLEGSNIMLLKRSDIKVIVDILLGSEMDEEEFELNELTISAVCEVMNQMMGAASTALSDFLGVSVNISTPQPFELDNVDKFKLEHLPQGSDNLVVVRFSLKIENALESEFMNVMSVELAKELLAGLGLEEFGDEDAAAEPAPAFNPLEEPAQESGGSRQLTQEEIEKLLAGNLGGAEEEPPAPAPQPTPVPTPQPEPAPQPAPPPVPQAPVGGQPPMPPMPNGQMGYPPMYYPPYPYPAPVPPEPKVISTQPVEMPTFDAMAELGTEQAQNLDLIMEVPLQVTVEIGRTQRKVQDILAFSKGSLVVLDKLAGDQVDIFVNGKCIARGDVVVIEDNFGVRITEIVQTPGAGLVSK